MKKNMYLKKLRLFTLMLFMGLNIVSYGQIDSLINIDSLASTLYQNVEVFDLRFTPLYYKESVEVLVSIEGNYDPNGDYSFGITTEGRKFNSIPIPKIKKSFLVKNLQKDMVYKFIIQKNTREGKVEVACNKSEMSTFKSEEFDMSSELFRKISSWSSNKNQRTKLSDFLKELDRDKNISTYEIASLVQKHYQVDFLARGIIGDVTTFFPVWPPLKDDRECLCTFAMNTHKNISPGTELAEPVPHYPGGYLNWYEGMTILPERTINYNGGPKSTSYSLIGNGAAKSMKLYMTGKHGDEQQEFSSFGSISGESSLTSNYTRHSYNLFCSGYQSDLPDDCICRKDLWYDYEYTSRLVSNVSVGGGGWIFSKGGQAVAEDYALLTVVNGDNISVEKAGKARVSTSCSSNWNSDWWVNAAALAVSTTAVATGNDPNASDWAGLAGDVVDVFSTAFYTGEGSCNNEDKHGILVDGKEKITLRTNQPVDIVLASVGYTYVRGYGKWTTSANITSDYFLTSVLLGNDIQNTKCCTDKIGMYHVGYFNDMYIPGIFPFSPPRLVRDRSINNASNLKSKASYLFSLYGPWAELERDHTGKYILTKDHGEIYEENKDCDIITNPKSPNEK